MGSVNFLIKMRFLNELWRLLRQQDLLDLISIQNILLQGDIEEIEKKNKWLIEINEDQIQKIEEISSQLDKYLVDPRAEYWNNHWKKKPIIYKAQVGYDRDVRNLLCTKSEVLSNLYLPWVKKGYDYDKIALLALNWVIRNVSYISDKKSNYIAAAEYWLEPEITYQLLEGDCEDMALLVASLLLGAKVPSYKVKVAAGWVYKYDKEGKLDKTKKFGHAYCLYLASDDKWYVLDGAYYEDKSKEYFKKVEHKDIEYYGDIFYTFNNEYCWSDEEVVL